MASLAVVVGGLIVWWWPTGSQSRQVGWWLESPPSGTAFVVVVNASGSSCVSHDRVEVHETPDVVTVSAYNRVSRSAQCTADYIEVRQTVELQAPLGSRELRGCFGADHPPDLDPALQCKHQIRTPVLSPFD